MRSLRAIRKVALDLLQETVLWGMELEADDAEWNYHFQQSMIRLYARHVGEEEEDWSDETVVSDADADVNGEVVEASVVKEE